MQHTKHVAKLQCAVPLETSSIVDASLHMLWGGRHSRCFTSATLQVVGVLTTTKCEPQPRELRTVSLISSCAASVLAMLDAGAGGCILQQSETNAGRRREEFGASRRLFEKGWCCGPAFLRVHATPLPKSRSQVC
jgi:hypothetical protein